MLQLLKQEDHMEMLGTGDGNSPFDDSIPCQGHTENPQNCPSLPSACCRILILFLCPQGLFISPINLGNTELKLLYRCHKLKPSFPFPFPHVFQKLCTPFPLAFTNNYQLRNSLNIIQGCRA
uniref:Uncharacterized protein n=1 Tax=Sphaerodactylus townsendi TaxID=933632 RepID=A0ACB8F4R5_9SAUR